MRERLIGLIDQADEKCKHTKDCKNCSGYGKGSRCMNYHIADHLLANGVIVPPCKVGDVVYVLHDKKVCKTKVFSMVAETEDGKWIYILKCNIFDGISMFKKFLFGKTVFLTREEAEAKLKESVK